MNEMIVGVDFDNTIVCYNQIFYVVAVERRLIPPDFPQDKEVIRDYLRSRQQEDEWTELQGYVYGNRMICAAPFPGVIDFFKEALRRGITLYIISHKTQFPYIGPKYDLQRVAYHWLESNGFFSKNNIGLDKSHVFFLETKQLKCEMVAKTHCSFFIDDLPEFLLDPAFPSKTQKLLFSSSSRGVCDNRQAEQHTLTRFASWLDIQEHLFSVAYA